MLIKTSERIPRSGTKREILRKKGQFWTPDWIADIMVDYVLRDKPSRLLDPALGEGAFFRAAKRYALIHGFELKLWGRDIDPEIIEKALNSGLSGNDLEHVELRDFVFDPPTELFSAIIANPPYIRHHRLSAEQKVFLRKYAQKTTNKQIDGRAGFHVYFLIRALQTLSPNGRLAYIVSADICEGVFAHTLWQWICAHYKLESVITFTPEAAPFPDVDTNAIIFFIQNTTPSTSFEWIKCLERNTDGLSAMATENAVKRSSGFQIYHRQVSEALATGFSRPPREKDDSQFTLGDFATVMRGIVTGNNDFFFMTSARARQLGIPDSMLVNALGRIRDVEGDNFGIEDLERLETSGRPTRLLNVNGFSFDQLPLPVQKYLKIGEEKGLPDMTLIKTRKPWYRMEYRKVPPILFAYLGRRNARFIMNSANVVPLTCLLCIYPKNSSPEFTKHLWSILSNAETIGNLRKVGKSYGGDAIKVEPRALERLPLPDKLVFAEGLHKFLPQQQEVLVFDTQ